MPIRDDPELPVLPMSCPTGPRALQGEAWAGAGANVVKAAAIDAAAASAAAGFPNMVVNPSCCH